MKEYNECEIRNITEDKDFQTYMPNLKKKPKIYEGKR